MKEINFPSHRLTAQNFHRTSKNISSVLGKCSTLICPAGFDCLFLCAQQPHPGGFYFVLLPNTRDVAQPLNNYHLHFSITHSHRNQYIFSGMNRDFCLSYLLKLVASFSLTSPWEMNTKDELIAQHGKTHTPTPTPTHAHTHWHTPVHTDPDTHVHLRSHTFMHTCKRMRAHPCTYTYTRTHACMHTHRHTLINTHSHTSGKERNEGM